MRKFLLPLLPIIMFIAACQSNSYKDVPLYTIEQFMDTKTIFGSSFSPDESVILFTNNETGIYNAYMVNVDGGEPIQITKSEDDAVISYSFFPNDKRILYRGDKGGNEIWHIYLRNIDGSIKDLTPQEEARAVLYGWADDEKSFYYGSNARDKRFMDVYEMEIEEFTSKLIYENNDGYNFGGISRDKNYMALSKTITDHNSEMFLYDFATKELKHISQHEGDINYSPMDFGVDSKSLYYLTNEGSEFTYLKKYVIETGKTELIEKAEWDIMYGYFSKTGKYMVLGYNQDAKTVIKVLNTETNMPMKMPNLKGNISSVNISETETKMAFYVNSSTSPSNLYVMDFEKSTLLKLTNSMNHEINEDDLVDGKVIRYKSFDGLEIPSILYKPHQIKPGEKAPALVWVHGGPGGQSRIGYRDVIQYLVNHGYVVLAVNNRGSSGYGKTFYKLDDMKHGEDDLDDCVKANDYLISTGYVDENKIGIIGGSYGGYMVLAALAYRPDAFSVGVDIFGVANWVRTLQSIPPWWEAFRKALYVEMGNPETDLKYLKKISPLFHADKITKPLIVLQGANDPRVLQVESDEMVAAVKENGVPVEYIVFEDEGHGFRKNENKIEGYKAILVFLEKYLNKTTVATEQQK